jgi:uncharacterized membrane protein
VRIQTEALTWENTMEFYDGMKYVHIALGVMALITFWLSGFSRKGSKLHTGSGKIYLLAMTGILISSSIMIVLFSAIWWSSPAPVSGVAGAPSAIRKTG